MLSLCLQPKKVTKVSGPFFLEVIGPWNAVAFTDGTDIPVNEFLEAASKFLSFFGSPQTIFEI
jgi:hypothetical protein